MIPRRFIEDTGFTWRGWRGTVRAPQPHARSGDDDLRQLYDLSIRPLVNRGAIRQAGLERAAKSRVSVWAFRRPTHQDRCDREATRR
jgi:hypothetical protein